MLYFGETPVKITSAAALTEKGVDEHSSFTLQYADGRIALLGTSMTAFGGASARIACTKGCIICEKLLQCEEIIIDNGNGVVRKENFPFDYNGYEYEIRSVIKAIEAGKSETEETPWSTTLNELRIMDTLRAQWGVKYPFE
jgi:predicted dehydrogenase